MINVIFYSAKPPDLVLFPESTQQVSQCAKICYEHNVPVLPFGTGTGLEGGVTAQTVRFVIIVCKHDVLY